MRHKILRLSSYTVLKHFQNAPTRTLSETYILASHTFGDIICDIHGVIVPNDPVGISG